MKKLCCVVSVVPVCIFTVNVSLKLKLSEWTDSTTTLASVDAIDLQHTGTHLSLLKTVSNHS